MHGIKIPHHLAKNKHRSVVQTSRMPKMTLAKLKEFLLQMFGGWCHNFHCLQRRAFCTKLNIMFKIWFFLHWCEPLLYILHTEYQFWIDFVEFCWIDLNIIYVTTLWNIIHIIENPWNFQLSTLTLPTATTQPPTSTPWHLFSTVSRLWFHAKTWERN